MSKRQDLVDQALAASAAANAVKNDPTSNQVTPPSTAGPKPVIPADAQIVAPGLETQGTAGYIAQSIKDAPGAIVRGVAGAVNQTDAAISDASAWTLAHLGFNPKDHPFIAGVHGTGQTPVIPPAVLPNKPRTGVGDLIEGVTSFGVGLLGAGKVMGTLGVGAEAAGLAKLGLATVKGGIAQYFTQDPQARNLFNILGDNLPVAKALTDYVAANKDDAPTTARFRSAVSGMALGAATDVLLAGAKYVKLNRLWQDAPTAAKAGLEAERAAAMHEVEVALNKTGDIQAHQNVDGTWTVRSNRPPQIKLPNTVTATLSEDGRPHPKNGGAPITEADRAATAANSTTTTTADGVTTVAGKELPTNALLNETERRNYTRTAKTKGTTDPNWVTNTDGNRVEVSAPGTGPAATPVPQEAPFKFATQAEAESTAASMNYALAEKQALIERPTTTIDADQASAINAQIHEHVSPDNPWMGQTTGIDFNLGNVSSDEGAKSALEATSVIMRKELDAARGGAVLTNEQLKDGVANLFGANNNETDSIIHDLVSADIKPNDLPIRLNAGRVLLDQIAGKAMRFSALLDSNPDNPVAFQKLTDHLSDLVRVAEVTKGRVTSAARATASGRITTGELQAAVGTGAKSAAAPAEDLLTRKFLTALPNMTPEQIQGFARKITLTNGDPGTLLQMMNLIKHSTDEAVKTPGFWDKVNTIWVNSVLSGPLTTAKNWTGNTIALGATPVERYLTGVYHGDAAIRQEGVDLFTGFFSNMRDSFNSAKNAFKAGKPILESGNQTNEIQNPFQGYLGTAIGVPSRALMAQDEFFKNLAYRSFIRSKALRSATEQGLTGADAANFVQQQMEESLAKGVALNNNALAFAQQATFTNPLTPGTVGASLSSFTNNHPAFRFAALPFVKTPTNILLWTWDRSPGIAFALKANREALQAGGERAAEVMARQSTGALAWGAATYLTLNGTITGSGPKDPAQQKLWRDAGNDPYSIKVGNKRYPFLAGDPLTTPFGIVADLVQASGELKAEDHDNLAMAFTTSLSRNLASKSYLYGLTDFMQAAFDGDTATLDKWVKNRVGSFVPAILNQTNSDDTLREMRDYTDQVIGRVPGLSQTLPSRVSFFGDPIMKAPFTEGRPVNPFTPSLKKEDHHVEDALLELGRSFAYPDKKYPMTDVDMTSRDYGIKGNLTPYDRLLQLMAHPGDGVPSLKTTLGKIVDSPAWATMSPGVPGIEEGGTRFDVINRQVQKYRGIAQKKLLLEFPDLRKAIDRSKITKKVAQKGGQSALDAIQGFLTNEPSH